MAMICTSFKKPLGKSGRKGRSISREVSGPEAGRRSVHRDGAGLHRSVAQRRYTAAGASPHSGSRRSNTPDSSESAGTIAAAGNPLARSFNSCDGPTTREGRARERHEKGNAARPDPRPGTRTLLVLALMIGARPARSVPRQESCVPLWTMVCVS